MRVRFQLARNGWLHASPAFESMVMPCLADTTYSYKICTDRPSTGENAAVTEELAATPNFMTNCAMTKTASRIVILFVVAAAVNFLWEVAQMPFYAWQGSVFAAAAHCILPSLGDGIMVLMTYAVGWLVLRRSDWSDRPRALGYMLMLLSGFTSAMLVEWGGVHVLGRWSYAANMPLLPGWGIGVLPILQMLVLPPIIFKVTARLLERHRQLVSLK